MILPYGKTKLVNTLPESRKELDELKKKALKLKAIVVSERFLADCEMISTGAFTPIDGFMDKDQVESVLKSLTLPNGLIWGIPIILLISEEQASGIKLKEKITLYDSQKRPIAIMSVTDKFKYSKDLFCKGVFKTVDEVHPGVKALKSSPAIFLAGPVQLLQRPQRRGVDQKYCVDPIETRLEFKKRGWETVVAFQTRNPLHRAHEFLINAALGAVNGALIHPLAGETKADDIPAEIRMKCYEALMAKYFPLSRVMLSVLLTSMRYAGPREALQHAIIRRNFGCTHFIVGRDHAGVGNFYGHYEAQELLTVYADNIGIKPVIFNNVFFCRKCANYTTADECSHKTKEHIHLSGTKIREMLELGIRPPLEFSRKEVVDILMNWAKNKNRTNN